MGDKISKPPPIPADATAVSGRDLGAIVRTQGLARSGRGDRFALDETPPEVNGLCKPSCCSTEVRVLYVVFPEDARPTRVDRVSFLLGA